MSVNRLDPEMLYAKVYGFSLFMGAQGGFVEPGYLVKPRKLPMQTTLSAAAAAAYSGQNSKKGAMTVLGGSSIINLLAAGPLQHVLGAIKST